MKAIICCFACTALFCCLVVTIFQTTRSQPTVRELRFGDDGCHGFKWPHHPHRRFPREWKNLVENILVELKQQSHENDELRLELEELRNTSTQQTQLLMDLTESVNRLVQTLVVSEKRRCPCAGSNPDRPERRGHGGGRRARGRNNNRTRGNQAPAPDFGTVTSLPSNVKNDLQSTSESNRMAIDDGALEPVSYGSGDKQLQNEHKVNQDIENSTTNTYNDGPFNNIFMINGSYPKDCDDIHQNGGAGENGVYLIKPDYAPHPFRVECEFESDKAWTLIQKRSNGEVDFYRGWNDYKNGFGTVGGEFWLGNEKIYYLSVQATYELQINMWDWEDVTRGTSTQTGNYYQGGSSFFFVEDEKNHYKLRVPEDFYAYQGQGVGSSGLRLHIGPFTTFDRKSATLMENCAVKFHCGWWFRTCVRNSNLNGRYYQGGYMIAKNKTRSHDDIYWYSVEQSLRRTVMKIHRISNARAKTSNHNP